MVDEWRKMQGLPPIGGKEGELRFQAINETIENGFEETADAPDDYTPDGAPGSMPPPDNGTQADNGMMPANQPDQSTQVEDANKILRRIHDRLYSLAKGL
jgi:hypothetical protein